MADPAAIAPAAEAAGDLAAGLGSIGLGGLAALASAVSVWVGRQLRPLETRIDKLEALAERADRLALRAEQAERELERLGARLDRLESQHGALVERVRESENAATATILRTEHAIERVLDRIRALRGQVAAIADGGSGGGVGRVADPVDSRDR